MNPTYNPITAFRIVTVNCEVPRPMFKFYSDPPSVPVCNAIGKTGLYALDMESKSLAGEVRKKVDDTLLVIRLIVKRSAGWKTGGPLLG